MRAKRILCLILTLVFVAGLLPMSVLGAEYSDTAGHWGQSAIERWSGYGVVQGDERGFRPDATMTRAEAAQVFVNLLGLNDTSDAMSFSDVSASAWYAGAIAKVTSAGVMNGMGDGTMNPEGSVSREEFFVMFARGLGIKPQETTSGVQADGAAWSAPYINALTDKGYVKGDGTGVNALADINRASVMALMDSTVTTYANENGATVEGTGEGIILVVADNVTVTGNVDTLVVAEGAAGEDGTGVTLQDATVTGSVNITAAVEVALEGETTAAEVNITASADGASLSVGEDVTVATITTAAEETSLSIGGTVETVEIAETATGTEVATTETATIAAITTEAAETSVSGKGEVASVTATDAAADSTTVSTPNTAIETSKTTTNADGSVTTTTSESKNDATGKSAGITTTETTENTDGSSTVVETVTDANGKTTTTTTEKDANGDVTDTKTDTSTASSSGGSSSSSYSGPTSTDVTSTYKVTPANLDDRANEGDEDDSELAGTYTATATQWSNRDYVDVTVSASALKAHLNGNEPADFGNWIGISFTAPSGATKYKAAVRLSQSNIDTAFSESSATDGTVFTQYVNAAVANQRDFWVKLQWFAEDKETSVQGPTTFHVVVNATLDTTTLGKVGTANLDDRGHTGDENDEALAENYKAEATYAAGTNFLTANVAITADTLKYHQNGDSAAALGDWIGFKVDGPTGATHYKAKAKLNADGISLNGVDATESTTFVQYTDYLVVDQREYYVLLQWFSDSGNTAVTCPVLYHVKVTVTTPETGAQAMTLRPDENNGGFAYNTEYGKAGITLTGSDGTATLDINGTTLASYVSNNENSSKVTKLSQTVDRTQYIFAGIQFTKPQNAAKVKVSTDGSTWGSEIQLTGVQSDGETGVYKEQLVLYFGVASVLNSTATPLTNGTPWTRYFQWLDGSDSVVGYTKAVITRTVTESAASS